MNKIQRQGLFTMVMAMVLGVACVTVNIYFPAAKVEKTAEEIVDEVYKGDQPQQKKTAPGPSSGLLHWLARLGPTAAHAADAVTVSNAAIRGLKNQIAQRHNQLRPYYGQGKVGINKDGYLTLKDQGGLNMKQLAQVKRLVNADNNDRRRLYQEVTRALNLPNDKVGQVQKIFANTWRNKAAKGWWIQEDGGRWKKK